MAAATIDDMMEQEPAAARDASGHGEPVYAPEREVSAQDEEILDALAHEAQQEAARQELIARAYQDELEVMRCAEAQARSRARSMPLAAEAEAPRVEPRTPLGGAFDAIDELMRSRDTLRARIMAGEDLEIIARAMLVCVLVCAGAVGASVGLYRGGIQVIYAAIKVPMVLLLATAAVAPVYTSMKAALRHEVSLREDFAMVLCSLALSCLVAAALSPLLLLTILNGIDYHELVLGFVGLFGLGGIAGYVFFFKALDAQVVRGHRLIAVTLLTTLAMVGCQLGWVMRPYVVRPKTENVPFIRDIEGSFLDSVTRSMDSARGIYSRADYVSTRRVDVSRGRAIDTRRVVPAPTETHIPPTARRGEGVGR